MNPIVIITHPACLKHDTGPFHVERPARIQAILEALDEKTQLARQATIQELALCHPLPYVELVKREIDEGRGELSTGDVVLSPGSWEAALYAAGAVLDGVDAALEGKRAFCVVRPPGHHAESERGMGFCLFNNIAIGARYAQKKYGVSRVLIVDWDVHHGNGTEEIFWNDPTVFYFSTHQHPLYPGTGLTSNEHIWNVPIAAGPAARQQLLDAFSQLPEKMATFQPELVMISCGFDANFRDPLGGLLLEDNDFFFLTKILTQIADAYAGGKIISCLEGGYDLIALAKSAKAHFFGLKG